MNEFETFLARQPRFDCERLRAVLTVGQCEANRKRLPEIFACIGCAGLGKSVELEERMSEMKCKCGAKVFAKGECRPCYDKRKHGERKARREARVEIKVPKSDSGDCPREMVMSVPCAACGSDKYVGETIWADECPVCGGHPITGAPLERPAVSEEQALPVITSLSSFLPTVYCPPGRVIHIPETLSCRMTKITDDDIIGLLDCLVHGELERHPYRRAA